MTEAQDESTDLIANPDGTLTWRQHVRPVRAKVGGQWRLADASLERRPDGSVAQKASTFPMTFSGGGAGPLASMVKDGKSLSLAWPTPLPQPELNGSTALYRDVLPGVDLQILAETDGFAHHLIVKSREAAADPRLSQITYGLKTSGITLATDPAGGLAATDGSGAAVFTAAAPTMWDSRGITPSAQASVPKAGTPKAAGAAPRSADEGAPDGAAPAREPRKMPTEVTAGSIRLTPDAALLHSADTMFPVIIDPTFTDGWRNRWAVVFSATPSAAYPNGSGWNSDNPADEPRVGYNGTGNTRSYFEMNTHGLAGATIFSSTFHVEETHSWVCDPAAAGNTELWSTGPIVTAPTWSVQAPWNQLLDADQFAHGNPTFCPGVEGHDFTSDALRAVVQGVADRNEDSFTLGLRTPDNYLGNKNSFKRFKNNPYLEVTFNRRPSLDDYAAWLTPWVPGSASNVNVPCVSDPASWPTVGNNNIELTAKVSDPDGYVSAKFEAWDHDSGQPVLSTWADTASGTWAHTTLSTGGLRDGGRYKWHVEAEDGVAVTGFGRDCGFNLDRTAPTKPTVTSADGHSIEVADLPPRVERKVRFQSSDAFGLTGFCYSLNKRLPVVNSGCGGTWVPAGPDGTATVTILPTLWPTNRLTVQATDKGGNLSPYDGSDGGANSSTTLITTAPNNYVHDATDPGLTGDRPGDLTGDGQPDLIAADTAGELQLYTGRGDGTYDAARMVGKPGWSAALVTHRGDFASQTPGQTRDGYEDYLVKLGSRLYLYPGNGMGTPQEDLRTELLHPSAGDWTAATQLVATGNIDGVLGDDLIVKEGDKLVLYSGTAAGPLATETGTNKLKPGTVVSASGWSNYELLAPGDVNRDGIADLLARRTTVDPADSVEYGRLRLVPGTRPGGSAQGFQTGSPVSGSVYAATGFDPKHLPLVTSPGNAHGVVADTGNGYRQFTPTSGQENGDILATTPADQTASVTYTAADGSSKTTSCPTGCLLLYPGTPTGLAGPRLVAQGGLGATTALDGGSYLRLPVTSMTRAANGTLVAFKTAMDGSLWGTNQVTTTSAFVSWYSVGTPNAYTGTPAPILSSAAGGTVHALVRTRAGQIVDFSQSDPTTGFGPGVPVGSGAPAFAADPSVVLAANGTIVVSALDTAGDLWATNQTAVGGTYRSWYKVSVSGGLSGATAEVRSSAQGGTVHLFARTTDGHVAYFAQSDPGSGFSSGNYLGASSPVFVGDPTVTVAASGGMIVAAVDANGEIWAIDQAQAGGSFRSWYKITVSGGTAGAASIVLSSGEGGTVNIVARATNGRIAFFGQSGPTTGFSSGSYLGDPSMAFGGDPRVMLADNGSMIVTAVDASGTTWAIDQPAPGASFRGWYRV
ncbi:hypothetical protein [Streptomyces sp. CB03911]|uniref:hypothetical protein n=1 Tax=Streptomyces sp. CB03911 TaxID=1804758 RepID=UPI0018FE586C|nr:hypothetical protein [Streptomyces sp. CB03911]